MEQKYQVKKFNGCPKELYTEDPYHWQWAKEIQAIYGLAEYYTITDIVRIWEKYSDKVCAAWLTDDKDTVEEAFNVKLEEV
jgi:hypothetical protein